MSRCRSNTVPTFVPGLLLLLLSLLPAPPSSAQQGPLTRLFTSASPSFDADQVIGSPNQSFVVDSDVTITVKAGHTLRILADKLAFRGGKLTVEGRGADGDDGRPGPDRNDLWISGGGRPHDDWVAAGSEVDVGPSGEPGHPGGRGATVEIVVSAGSDLSIINQNVIRHLDGGLGGKGGLGGRGRPLRCGVHPTEMKYGAPGAAGPTGPTGPAGSFKISEATPQVATGPLPKAIVDNPTVAYGIIASGGISAGTYEAGYNWALLRYLKAHNLEVLGVKSLPRSLNLVAVTGASAGSINTVLSAVTWCQKNAFDQKESPTQNIFYQTWVPVGFDELLPANGYSPDDAILARGAFGRVQNAVLNTFHEASRFRDKCHLPIGLTVTRRSPERLKATSLTAPVDRYSVVLEARTGDAGNLEMYDLRYEDEVAYARPYLHVVKDEIPLADNRIAELLRASSAFPVAFGLQKLQYYENARTVRANETKPARLELKPEYFWDGGLYDNLPVGLALSLVQKPPYDHKIAASRIRLVALDPGRRRTYSAPVEDHGRAKELPLPPRGLRRLSEIAANFYTVARNYELQTFIRFALPTILQCQKESPEPCIDDPLVSSRRFPIYGERLGAFGAFVLQAFREFDFAMGIYDGLYSFTEQDCPDDTPNIENDDLPRLKCRVRAFHEGWGRLRVDRDRNSDYLIRTLLRDELLEAFPDGLGQQALDGTLVAPGQSATQWIETAPAPSKYIAILLNDAKAVDKLREPESIALELDRIDTVVASLSSDKEARKGMTPGDLSFVDNSSNWLPETVNRVIRRDQLIEEEDQYRLGQQAANLASFAHGTGYLLTRRGLDLDPSTVPDDFHSVRNVPFHFLPNQLVASTRLIELGWRPTYGLWRHLAIGLPLGGSARFGTKDPYDWGLHAGGSVILRTTFMAMPALEFGPRYTWGWTDHKEPTYKGWGGQAASYWLGGKVRIGAEFDGYEAGWPNRLALTFGFADLNGMAFHALDFWGFL